MDKRRNILVCTPETPLDANDITNKFARSVVIGRTYGFLVQHYMLGEMDAAVRDEVEESFDQLDDDENIRVTVFHADVDPATRVCQSCGKPCGDGIPRPVARKVMEIKQLVATSNIR